MKRVLVLGLDGASPRLVRKWREVLPNLNRLMVDGTSGTLWSVIPPRSIPAWYCLATGMNPGKIGVFGFSQRIPGTYDYTFANMTHCRAPTLWEWLARYGLMAAVVNVPGTFPPQAFNGTMVSGWPGPLNRGNLVYTHPPELSRALDRHLGQPFEFGSEKPMRIDNDAEMLAERLRMLELHGRAALHILSEKLWNVAFVVLSQIDRASHQFWRHTDPMHPAYDPKLADRFQSALKSIYQASDRWVGRLLDLLDGEDTVFVVSDHGFGPNYRTFYLNEWLRQQGYLVLRKDGAIGSAGWRSKLLGALGAAIIRLNNASPVFRRVVAPLKKRRLSNLIRDEYVRVKERGLVRVNHAPVDWTRTKAYLPDEAALYLNLQARDPEGQVSPGGQAETLLTALTESLRAAMASGSIAPRSMIVHRKEEIYSGPFLHDAPELVISMDDHTTEVAAELGGDALSTPATVRSGAHTPEGLFIARGPDIPANKQMDTGLLDIAPTVLHLLGVPIPQEVDGKVRLDLFAEDTSPRTRPVQYGSTEVKAGWGQAYTAEEEAQVEQRLRDLGYLG